MKLYRGIDDKNRLIIPKDVLEQIGFTNLEKCNKIEIDVVEYGGKKVAVLSLPSEENSKKILKG